MILLLGKLWKGQQTAEFSLKDLDIFRQAEMDFTIITLQLELWVSGQHSTNNEGLSKGNTPNMMKLELKGTAEPGDTSLWVRYYERLFSHAGSQMICC